MGFFFHSLRFLIGLGNPGPKYVSTRHNFGFLLLDRVSEELNKSNGVKLVAEQTVPKLGHWQHFRWEGGESVLLWPLTYMNLSGQAVEAALEAFAGESFNTQTDLLVVIDDLSMPLGRLRFRKKGSPGGHNGLKSVEAHLGHAGYPRLKLGIGRPDCQQDVVDFVLEPFSAEEQSVLEEVLNFASQKALQWVRGEELGVLSSEANGWLATEAGAPKISKNEEQPEE